jgi:hypothetical protein
VNLLACNGAGLGIDFRLCHVLLEKSIRRSPGIVQDGNPYIIPLRTQERNGTFKRFTNTFPQKQA